MRRILAATAACVLTLAGCGGAAHHKTAPAFHKSASLPSFQSVAGRGVCPKGASWMGCSVVPSPSGPASGASVPSSGGKIPDVSMWQGVVDWPAVKGWQLANRYTPAAIFKMGEATFRDPQAANNAHALAALGFWRSGYWFVRNIGCSSEAAAIIQAAHDYGLKVVWLDLEVPEASGYGLCLSPPLKRAGLIVGEYTAPGTNPGGVDTSDPLWEATYGSGFSPIWHPVVAWQCTDGVFGCVTFIPGIGRDDVSIDLGATRLGVAPPPPDPYAYLSKIVFWFFHHRLPAEEYTAVKLWDELRCENPVRRRVCQILRLDILKLRDRIWFVAHEGKNLGEFVMPGDWRFDRGIRWQALNLRLTSKHVLKPGQI